MTMLAPMDWQSEIITRNGLAGLRRMLLAEPCKIAYLGASVTAQKEGYRGLLEQWFTETFRQPHSAINAGFGGVGSISGVFVMDDQVISQQPDLCLIEYSTGDMGGQTTLTEIAGAVEGMVLKLRDIGCQVCFLYLYRRDEALDNGHPVIAEYERVAAHYGIPSLHIGRLIQQKIAAGCFSADDIVRDKVHTTAKGSKVTADCITGGLQIVFDASSEEETDAVRNPAVPLASRNYHRTQIVPATRRMLRDPENFAAGRFRFAHDYIRIDNANEIGFVPTGELVGLLVIVGRDAGIIEVSTTESTCQYTLWDEWCNYNRLTTVILSRPLSSGTSVRIRLTGKHADYAAINANANSTTLFPKHLHVVGFLVRGESA